MCIIISINNINCLYYKSISKLLVKLLPPLVKNNVLALKNSAELATTLNECQLDETDIIISFDVTACICSCEKDINVFNIFITLD